MLTATDATPDTKAQGIQQLLDRDHPIESTKELHAITSRRLYPK